MSLNDTPRANRLHIGIFGGTNNGKSTLINALTGQEIALVSDIAGTTADPVYKSMEIHGIGPCVFIDTAGFDDTTELGALRIEKTKEAVDKTDIALMVYTGTPAEEEKNWVQLFKTKKIPVIHVLNTKENIDISQIIGQFSQKPVVVNAKTQEGIDELRQELIRALPQDYAAISITANLIKPADTVLLVMPQDIQAPAGRLILPQVQTIRELLDRHCICICTTTGMLDHALNTLKEPPALIITDSQVFKTVFEKKPKESILTSFSVLFAAYKGDIDYFKESAYAIGDLKPTSKVLIAEACTHAPLSEDIGRVKIPAMLKKRIGSELTIDMVAGQDFPKDLTPYDLIIHCGACMFNRKYVLSRMEQAKAQHVPMTNYGITIAYLQGILDKIAIPTNSIQSN